MTNHLSTKVMLVDLSISFWTAKKYDRKVSKEVADNHKTTERVGRYRKNLMMDAPSFDTILTAKSAARTEHYKRTLPWSDSGARILTATSYLSYTEAMRHKRSEFEQAVKSFLLEFPALHRAAKEELKTLYVANDYPAGAELESKFSFSVKIIPLPEGRDFRVDLAGEEVIEIKKQIDKDKQQAVSEAMGELLKRLHEPVARMVKQLKDAKGIVRDSLVDNLREICNSVPAFNFTDDPKITEISAKIETALTRYSPEELRSDKKIRAKIAREAEKIQSDLSAFMGGGS